MNQNDVPATRSGIDYWLTRSWTGYGLLSMGVVMLAVGLSSALETFGWPGAGLLEVISGAAMLGCFGLLGVSLIAKVAIRIKGKQIEIEPRTRYSKLAGGCFAIGIGAIMLSLVVPASTKARRTAQEASRITYELGNGSVLIEVPSTFQFDPETPIRGGIAVVDSVRELTIIAYANHVADLIANTPRSYAVQCRESLLESTPNGSSSEIEVIRRGTADEILRQTFAYEQSGLKYVNTIDVQKRGPWIIDVRFIASPSRLDSWRSEMNEITALTRLASDG